MIDSGVSASWEPGEIIYEAGSHPQEAYLILEGFVNIETKDEKFLDYYSTLSYYDSEFIKHDVLSDYHRC